MHKLFCLAMSIFLERGNPRKTLRPDKTWLSRVQASQPMLLLSLTLAVNEGFPQPLRPVVSDLPNSHPPHRKLESMYSNSSVYEGIPSAPLLYFCHSRTVSFSHLDANTAMMNEFNTSSFIAFKAHKLRVAVSWKLRISLQLPSLGTCMFKMVLT